MCAGLCLYSANVGNEIKITHELVCSQDKSLKVMPAMDVNMRYIFNSTIRGDNDVLRS